MEEQATAVVEAAAEYVGRWNRLVSTTNWEKGRIIFEWREALGQAGAPAASLSDEAWSRQVGGVTSQHVGRLHRVYERFGAVHGQYAGLYWSHFQAALDWPDAEMYLEGAVQNGWSVSQMRNQRWEVLGGRPELKPREEEIVAAEVDEEFPRPATTCRRRRFPNPWAKYTAPTTFPTLTIVRTQRRSMPTSRDRARPSPRRPMSQPHSSCVRSSPCRRCPPT